jgi:hypothetical protein
MTQESAWQSNLSAETGPGGVGYTPEDVALVAGLLHEAGCGCGSVAEPDMERARTVLAALAAAGRLLPEDTRTERDAKDAVLADFHTLNPRIPGLAVDGCHCNLLAEVAFTALRRVGPWVPVPAEPAPLCSACAGAGWPDGIHACPACGGSGEEKPQ